MENLHSTEIENSLQTYESIPGDAYFISAGTVHAIGAGNLLLEIQQNSNTTYRISDWGRIGFDGKSRELHIDEALKCINFMNRTSPRVSGVSDKMAHNRRFPLVKTCPYFKMDELKLVESMLDHTNGSSFHLLTAINNPITVKSEASNVSVKVKTGSSTLIPASMGTYSIGICEEEMTTVIKTSF
jgi:mannose-6-phosphate isomerase